MKEINLFLLILILVFSGISVLAQEDEFEPPFEVPEGMEFMKVGNAYILLPKDGKVHLVDDLVIPESPHEYTTRKFLETDQRLAELEAQQEEIKKELKQLKELMEKLNKPKVPGTNTP